MKFRPTSKAAASALPFARRLAASMGRRKGIKHQVINGFLLRAVSDGQNVTVYAIEPGGFLGAGYGNLLRTVYSASPIGERCAAVMRMSISPISPQSSSVKVGSFHTFVNHGGVTIGGPLTWNSDHNTMPWHGAPRCCPMPSALLMPAVAGERGAASNTSVIVQRLNARMQCIHYNDSPNQGSTYFRTPMALNQGHAGAAESIAYVEIAGGALNLGDDYSPRSGDVTCLEWGATDGIVMFNAWKEGSPATDSYKVSEASGGTIDGTYSPGHTFGAPTGALYAYLDMGAPDLERCVCVRYTIDPPDPDNDQPGHTGRILWKVVLDGSGATGDLAPPTPPSSSTQPAYTPAGLNYAPMPANWGQLWDVKSPLVWSSHAGIPGGNKAAGEVIIGVCSVLTRRFRSLPFLVNVSTPITVLEEWGASPLVENYLMTYMDRHAVRFKINPETGSVTYESLYTFANCFNARANSAGSHRTGAFHSGDIVGPLGHYWMPFGFSTNVLSSFDTDVLVGYEIKPLAGFTDVSGETRQPFIACSKVGTIYEVLPECQDRPAKPAVRGSVVGSTLPNDPDTVRVLSSGYYRQGKPAEPASPAYREVKRNPTKQELIDAIKLIVVGESGAPVEMNTGDYYPDFGDGGLSDARYNNIFPANKDYQAEWTDRGSPVCHYAPGIIAIVVIPKAQFPEPRPFWPWPAPWPSPAELDDRGNFTDEYDDMAKAVRAIPSEPATPAPQPQDRHIALCDIRTGALIAVSPAFHTSTALQDTPRSPHRGATFGISCMELGEVNNEGALTRHAGLLLSVHEPVRRLVMPDGYTRGPGTETASVPVKMTWDFCQTVIQVASNGYGAHYHYLGSALKPAKIGVTTGNSILKGALVTP